MGEPALEDQDKLTVVKSVRMSARLMRLITEECGQRNLDFSDFMRNAALAAMKQREGALDLNVG
jgi:hypothetical protein